MRRRQLFGLSSFIALAVASAFPAQAAEPDGVVTLEDIVVTAEKRASTEQKTAIAMSVMTAETLEKNSVGSVADLVSIAPSVSFSQAGPATVVTVRGVSSRDTTEIGDPAVSISIDGFNLQRALGLNAALFDLERVEVLRGPQGTLLGRNATGGALNIVTGKPTEGFAASVGAEVGDYQMFNTKGMINVPVNDWLKVRAAFQVRDRDGYRDNAPAEDGDDEHTKAARLHLLFTPTEAFKLLLTAEYVQQRGVGPVTYGIPWRLYTAADVPPGLLVGDVNLSKPDRSAAEDFPLAPGSFLHTRSWNYRAQADYDFGFATLTYQGGYRLFKISRRTLLGTAYGTQRQNLTFGQSENLPSWNHELRLSSNGDGPLKWQGGVYYYREENDLNTQFQDYPEASSISGVPFLLQDYHYPDITSKAKAVFGQISYEFMPGVTAEAGLRRSKDDKHRIGFNVITNFNTYIATRCYRTNSCVFVTTPQNSDASSKQTTYHAALNYQLTPRNLVYAKFDTGYKAGGFTDLADYAPEKIKAYEIGSKNRFLDNTLQLNLSAFLYDYTDQQVSQTVTNAAGGVATLVQNAGKSRYKGVELDALYQPTADDRFNLYIGYLHGRFTDFEAAAGGQIARVAAAEGRLVAGNYQLKGKRPPQSPDWTVNFGYEHDFHVWGGRLTPRIQTHYESKSYFTIFNFESDKQSGYHRTDALVTYTPEDGNWTVSGWVRNIEDEVVLSNAQAPTSATFQAYREQYLAPRTYGLSVTYDW